MAQSAEAPWPQENRGIIAHRSCSMWEQSVKALWVTWKATGERVKVSSCHTRSRVFPMLFDSLERQSDFLEIQSNVANSKTFYHVTLT